jgi:hypothetical protein
VSIHKPVIFGQLLDDPSARSLYEGLKKLIGQDGQIARRR